MPKTSKAPLAAFLSQLTTWDLSFVSLLVISLTALLIGELMLFPWRNVATIICMVMTWIAYSQTSLSQHKYAQKLSGWLLYLSLGLVLFYVFLRFLHVYDLPKYPWVHSYCSENQLVCDKIVSLFFASKFYRFITLSITFLASLVYLFGGLYLISNYQSYTQAFITKFQKEPLMIPIAIACIVLFLNQAFTISNRSFVLLLMTWENKHLEFRDRFVPFEFGIEHHGWIWEYAKFVNRHVPENSTIFIPPQSDVWPQEGNKYYFRWFVYPRWLLNSTDPIAKIPSQATHMLISRGGWQGGTAGWPKKIIASECVAEVFVIDRYTLQEKEVAVSDLATALKPSFWGIITLTETDKEICL